MLTKKDWKEIIYKNGKPNIAQIFRELSDYAFLMEQASKVYCHFTGLSKTNYYAATIISAIEERMLDRETTQDDVVDILERSNNQEELVKELKEYFEIDV